MTIRTLALLVATSTMFWYLPAKADEWPPLPTKGFISGRPAVLDDVKNGDALFVAAVGNQSIGQPIAVAIPQYVYLNGLAKTKAILVQAEEARGTKIYGVRTLDGKQSLVQESEIQLLGVNPP